VAPRTSPIAIARFKATTGVGCERGGGRDRDPRSGVGAQPLARPALERDRERVLEGVLGEVEIAEDADHDGRGATRLLAEDAPDCCLAGGNGEHLPSRGRLGEGARFDWRVDRRAHA
jgi:hypothetical protein